MPEEDSLEYAEEDVDDDGLFGSGDEAQASMTHNTAKSLPAPSSSRTLFPSSSKVAGPSDDSTRRLNMTASDRYNELQHQRRSKAVIAPMLESGRMGVRSLRDMTLTVIQINSTRIWDIGDMMYQPLSGFINLVPMDQLVEIELNSPHIKKDTDWLWEAFTIHDYPLFYERCRGRHGEARTSGWRRMYKKAIAEAEERQTVAADRLAQRYKQLEEEKSAKRIVFVDKVTAPVRGRGKGGPMGGMVIKRAGEKPLPMVTAKGSGAIAKARADAQRARIAKTHASGKYTPPVRPIVHAPSTSGGDLFRNPYLPPSSSSSSSAPSTSASALARPAKAAVDGPRLPPPRSSRATGSQTRAPSDLISGAVPTAQLTSLSHRTALPTHLQAAHGSASQPKERFKVDPSRPKELKTIRKPSVENFAVPQSKTVGQDIEIFSSPRSTGASMPSRPLPSSPMVNADRKRKAEAGSPPGVEPDRARPSSLSKIPTSVSAPTASPRSTSAYVPRPVVPTQVGSPKPILNGAATSSGGSAAKAVDEAARISSVLFRKKKPLHGHGK